MDMEFIRIIRPIVKTENYKSMKKFNHHKHFSTYYHSIKVAYIAYNYAKKHKLKIDINELVRAALLHDYYLYDWHTKSKWHKFHGFKHPYFALKNALKEYPDLTKREKNAILRHMFPLVPIPPRYRISWIITWSDKIAAFSDYRKKHRKKK